jgi:hypothetical protein
MFGAIFGPGNICAGPASSPAGRQEALPALSNQNDEEAARGEKGPEIFILSLAQNTRPQGWDLVSEEFPEPD